MHPDPGHERKPVTEACIDRVLDVRVRVDKAWNDDASCEMLAATEGCGGSDRRDRAVAGNHDRTVPDGLPFDGDDPVGRDDRQGISQRSLKAAPSRFHLRSIRRESQMDDSNRISSGTVSNSNETGSTVGRRIANTIIST